MTPRHAVAPEQREEGVPPPVQHSGEFDVQKFDENYNRYLKGELSYRELEELAGGLPAQRGALRRLWDALEMGIGLGAVAHLMSRAPRRR